MPHSRTSRSRTSSSSCWGASSRSSTRTPPRSCCWTTTRRHSWRALPRASRRRSSGECASRSAAASPGGSRRPGNRCGSRTSTRQRSINPILREKGLRSLLGVPLLREGGVIGVMHVGTLTQRDVPRRGGRAPPERRGPGRARDLKPPDRARAQPRRRAPEQPDAAPAGASGGQARGPLPARGVGAARRRLVRRLPAPRRPARYGDRRRGRARLPRRGGHGPAAKWAARVRARGHRAQRGAGAAEPAAAPAGPRRHGHGASTW